MRHRQVRIATLHRRRPVTIDSCENMTIASTP
jgi:hypothetical protein